LPAGRQGRSQTKMEDNLFTSPSKKNEDYEKVPLLHPGRMKTGAAFNQQNDYTPFVSNVKGILQNICRNILPLKTSSPFK
jgi:hypothetical protein